MMEDKIREVLGKLVDNSALALKQIFLEMLPEPKCPQIHAADNWKVRGYNQCLTEIKAKLTASTQQGITGQEVPKGADK